MSRTNRATSLICLSALCIALTTASARSQTKPAEGPPSPAIPEVIPIFLAPPLSLDDFWRKLDQPDFVLISGATYKSMVASSPLKPPAQSPATAFVTSVVVGGRVGGDLARLSIKLGLSSSQAERQWVPIGLDGLAAIASVREANRDLSIRATSKGGWEVELTGAGKHELLIEAIARVSQSGDQRKLTVPIPISSSTALDLEIEERVADAVIGEKELVTLTPGLDGERSRVVGSLTPRDRIVLNWRGETAATLQLPPLLDVEGELAIDVDPDWIRTRSTWQISASRGITKELTLTLDPTEELLGVELDGRTIPNEVARDAKSSRLVITLSEPLRQGTSRRLSLITRRKLTSGQSNRVRLNGYPIENAQIQTGAIAVNKTRPVFVDGSVGRALRRVDPRTELPDQLRGRPGTVLAYQFADQPFDLWLQVDPAPPRIRVEPRTTITVASDRAHVDTWLDYNTTRGQVFDVEVDLANGMELDGWGPEDIVSGAEYARDEPTPNEARDRPQRLILHLTPKAREAGNFRIHLAARQNIQGNAVANVDLFRPRGENPLGGLVALLSSPGVDVALAKPSNNPSAPGLNGFSVLNLPAPPSDWIWPLGLKPEAKATASWLREPGTASRVPIQVTIREQLMTHETAIIADVRREWVEIEQETLVAIPFGTLRKLDISVPPEVGPWSVDKPILAGNDLLATEPDGTRRYRLTLDREVEDSALFRFRFRLPLRAEGKVALTALKPLDLRAIADTVRVTAPAGLDVTADAKGWENERSEGAMEGRSRDRFRLARESATAPYPRLIVRADPVLTMPGLVASRLLLRSAITADGELLTQARFAVDMHGPAIDVELPAGSVWIRAEVNERVVTEIESRPQTDHYRIVLPEGLQTGPVAMSLEFRTPNGLRRDGFTPVVLTDGFVQQTYWEFRLPWSQLAIGVPRGWNDENRWEWEFYAWKRKPALKAIELASWVTAGSTRSRAADASDPDTRSGEHGYLFSRVGEPGPLRLTVLSKAWVLALCTGVVSLLGVLAALLRLPARMFMAGLIGVFLGLILVWDTSVAFTLFQSSIFGLVLAVSAWILQWVVDRRRGERRSFGERMGSSLVRSSPSASTSDALAVPLLGSDHSTTVRKRPAPPANATAQPEPSAEPPPARDDMLVIAPPPSALPEGSTTTPISPR